MSKVSVGILVLVVGLAMLSGTTGPVYAYYCHSYSGHCNSWGGGWGGYHGYSYWYPYYSYYYYPSWSYWYPNYYGSYGSYGSYYGSYGSYPYSYSYGYGNYGYNQQYQLTVNANPSTLSNAVTGGGQYSQGSSASFTANQNVIQVSQDTRYVFSQWTGDFSGSGLSGSITMDAAKSVTAVYQQQYYLSVSSQPSTAGTLQGSGWFNSGTSTVISVPAQVVSGDSGSRLTFSGWSVDGSQSQTAPALTIQMNAPHTVVAQYTQQYYLTVSSDQGSVSGGGWYNSGSYAQISASTPPSPNYGVSMVFNGWQGDLQSSSQSTTVLMDGPKSVTATWRADPTVLYLTVGVVIALIAVAAWIGAQMLSRRNKSGGAQWQSFPPSQTTYFQPSATAPNVNPTASVGQPNTVADVQSPANPTVHRHRRHRAPVTNSEPSNPEGTNAPKTEGQT